MTYFKVIKRKKVISVGCVFLKWNETKNKFYVCDTDEGQFVQSYDELHIYHDKWMKPAPVEAGKHEEATVEVISQQEYEDILETLKEGEVIEEVELVVPEQHETPPEEEKPMTIAEMREIILKQQDQINTLIELLN